MCRRKTVLLEDFEVIKPYSDSEVPQALQALRHHPMVKALLRFAFPKVAAPVIWEQLDGCTSIHDFQTRVIYHAVMNVLKKTSKGYTVSGFEKLSPQTPYLFISNHRDIVLDTSLLNMALFEKKFILTASAIGDNLVQKPFLLELSKLNRNFLIRRNLSPREMLQSSKSVSNYIGHLLFKEERSVWIAQREGRTKDGDDRTHPGVLKMLAMAAAEEQPMEYLKKARLTPVAISYEFDPTDILKMPELIAKHHDRPYKKSANEDFNSILRGISGQKGHIHIAVSQALSHELDIIKNSGEPLNKQFQMLAEVIDARIHQQYKLWPSNYIAYDMLYKTHAFSNKYTHSQKKQFERRLKKRALPADSIAISSFLSMYANPVVNALSYKNS